MKKKFVIDQFILLLFITILFNFSMADDSKIHGRPFVEVDLKIEKFDQNQITATLKDGSRVFLKRAALQHPIVQKEFNNYKITVEDWDELFIRKSN